MITFYKSTILLLSLGFVLCVMGLNAQQITSFSPKKIIGGMEEVLVIRGIGFGEVRNNSYVSFFTESGNYSPFEAANGYAYRLLQQNKNCG